MAYVVHSPKTHFSDAFKALKSLYYQKDLCDVILKTEDAQFHAHKVVLVACCRYFAAMFRSGMEESQKSEVILHDVDPVALKCVLELFYTGHVTIKSDNVQSLLSAASLFQIDHLVSACLSFLKQQLSPSNCLGIKSFAGLHSCQFLVEAAERYSLARFTEVTCENEFLELTFEEVSSLTSNNKLNINSEDEVFDAIKNWILHDKSSRIIHLTSLLSNVRMSQLSPSVLVDKILRNDLIQNDIQCRNLIDDILIYTHVLTDRKHLLPSSQLQKRMSISEDGVIYVVGGLGCTENSVYSVERFDIHDGAWYISEPMDIQRSRVGVAELEGKIYVFGGYDGTINRLSVVECYDIQTEKWSSCSPMLTCRSAMGVAVLGDQIFIIGGYDGIHSLNSVEVYSVPDDKWTMAPPLLTNRSAPGAAVVNGCIYVMGGHDGLSIFSSVERYDPELQQWVFVANMNSQRCRLGVTAAVGKIFSIGGYDGHQCLDSVECYDPATNVWQLLPKMIYHRSRVAAVTVGNQIYAIGGYNGVSNMSSIEVYDIQREEWSVGPPMRKHYGAVGVAVIT
ncbi:PREDICTED: kelch-like protein 18 [Amphimedon queenslandica]|uniref:BTB domain-containing protein n=1 Tax=Amphimedon queenslandica TaxID=400682 RepID=A0A1X7VK24_AMPQE|nr:PREDICTED: kelch-like protein 18 [Amphimedon queenslandica]|eukprot:XP_019864480.1 PREDICTED: kelch-like protein 18 [Amphimedon queenslandica]